MLPVFSLWRSGNITESIANDLLSALKVGVSAYKWTRIVGVVIFALSLSYLGYVYYRKKNKDNNRVQSLRKIESSIISE